MNKYVLEYVWLDGDSTMRSKTRVITLKDGEVVSEKTNEHKVDVLVK